MERLKLTKREGFEMLLNIEEVKTNKDLVDLINREIQNLDKKKLNRSSATNETTLQIKELVYQALERANAPVTITKLLEDKELADYTYTEGNDIKKLTNQKINSILKVLLLENKVVNTKDKKKSYYSVVAE